MSNLNLNFDFIILSEFIRENSDFLCGARFQKIQQPTRQELVFFLRNNAETRKLYVNISPRFFHICFMSEATEKMRRLQIPQKPPMFCMLLRKYLEGSKVAKVEQPQGERILELYFETYNELSEKIYLCLAIELMGKHSNVVLYNFDTNMIIGCAHNVGADKSSVREIIGGLPYAYPPRKSNKILSGLSSVLLQNTSVNETIDTYFAPLQEGEKILSLKSTLLNAVNSKLKKTLNSISKMQKQAPSAEKSQGYLKKADLIMSNLYNNRDFSKSIEVTDYESGLDLKIELDETKTLKENANRFYKLYNKAKIANEKTQEILENLYLEKEYLEGVLYSIECAQNMEELLEIEEELFKEVKKARGQEQREDKKARGQEGKQKKGLLPASNLLTFHHSLFTIYVGKNNKQNDYIVSKLARGEDLWFHTRNCAGSHVLLRVEAGQEVTDEIIFECAKLAKEYSAGKNSSKVGVIYTQAKNLKKPPKANLGYVIYKGEKEIVID